MNQKTNKRCYFNKKCKNNKINKTNRKILNQNSKKIVFLY